MKWLVVIALAGCQRTPEQVAPAPGTGDCQVVAEVFTSFELGHYAQQEERAPVIAKYKAQCESARVSKEESECVAKTRDKQTAQQCVPKMVPAATPAAQ